MKNVNFESSYLMILPLLVAAGTVLAGPETELPAGEPGKASTVARPTEAVPLTGCVTADCHPGIKRFGVVHGPVNVDACDVCHESLSAADHTFKPTREKEKLCTFCHQVEMEGAEVIHEPLKTGECHVCHDPHGGANRFLLKAPTPDELCNQCHKDVIGQKAAVHGPVAAGACSACHAPHTSKFPKLLGAEGPELCLQCHASIKTQIDTMRVHHEPVVKDCRQCHDAHASDHKMMLKEEPKTLCVSCHEEIKHTVETAKTQHAAVTTEQACLNCHDAHASDHPRVLKDDMLALCFQCHDKEIELENGKELMNIKEVLETGKSLHGPIVQHDCAACHQIHGGSHFRLLVKQYPPEFYAPFKEENYALCFSCHEKQLVYEEKTTSLTDFRNGDTSLHYLHVNKETKGRTCRACHETHASNKEKHIREAVPFGTGGWMLPIGYEKTETGGRCSPGCHKPYAYDRDVPVNNKPLDKAPIWPEAGGKSTTQPATQPATRPAQAAVRSTDKGATQ